MKMKFHQALDKSFTFLFLNVCNDETEVVYVTIGNPTFCLAFYLTGVHFRGKLQHVGHVGEQKLKCRPSELEK